MTTGSAISLLRSFAAGSDATAGIEVGLGAAALLTVSLVCFDVYSVSRVDTAGARSAVAIAEYVSREIAPVRNDISALAQFLHENEFGAPVSVAFVISAVHRPVGATTTNVLWSHDTIRFGDSTATTELAAECSQRGTQGWRAFLLRPPADSGMTEGETLFVVEACVRPSQQGLLTNLLIAGDSYHLHLLPARDNSALPSAPT